MSFVRENNIWYGLFFIIFMVVMILPINMCLYLANIKLSDGLNHFLSIIYNLITLGGGVFLSLYTYKNTTEKRGNKDERRINK